MVKRAGIALAMLATGGCAMDWGRGYGRHEADEAHDPARPVAFRCESIGGKQRYCSVDTRAGVHLVKQLSNMACVEGRTWGYDRFGVWVTYGCRAEFRTGGDGGFIDSGQGLVRCESLGTHRQECRTETGPQVKLLRQRSKAPCVEGQSWGWSVEGVWVDHGCRADFKVR